jgi:hypothetical protein
LNKSLVIVAICGILVASLIFGAYKFGSMSGEQLGYNKAQNASANVGHGQYMFGFTQGNTTGYTAGYEAGYNDGLQDGNNTGR